jgi:hypothetical protein
MSRSNLQWESWRLILHVVGHSQRWIASAFEHVDKIDCRLDGEAVDRDCAMASRLDRRIVPAFFDPAVLILGVLG